MHWAIWRLVALVDIGCFGWPVSCSQSFRKSSLANDPSIVYNQHGTVNPGNFSLSRSLNDGQMIFLPGMQFLSRVIQVKEVTGSELCPR